MLSQIHQNQPKVLNFVCEEFLDITFHNWRTSRESEQPHQFFPRNGRDPFLPILIRLHQTFSSPYNDMEEDTDVPDITEVQFTEKDIVDAIIDELSNTDSNDKFNPNQHGFHILLLTTTESSAFLRKS